jgi:hypothetical protein
MIDQYTGREFLGPAVRLPNGWFTFDVNRPAKIVCPPSGRPLIIPIERSDHLDDKHRSVDAE